MDTKTFAIGILSVIASVLFAAQFFPVAPAQAAEAIKDRDYQLITARAVQGGEQLYVIDNRTGLVAVFNWDPGTRSVRASDVTPMSNFFSK